MSDGVEQYPANELWGVCMRQSVWDCVAGRGTVPVISLGVQFVLIAAGGTTQSHARRNGSDRHECTS